MSVVKTCQLKAVADAVEGSSLNEAIQNQPKQPNQTEDVRSKLSLCLGTGHRPRQESETRQVNLDGHGSWQGT